MRIHPPTDEAPVRQPGYLTSSEADFHQAVFERILPEAPDVCAVAYVERKLAALTCSDAGGAALAIYRDGIAGA
jgi:hypothetical protein